MPNLSVLIIFAKAPVSGQVKTRLQSHLSAEECANLHSSFIIDTIDIAGSVQGASIQLACYPDIDHPFFRRIARDCRIELFQQAGADLGERMSNSIEMALTAGYKKVIIIGSDSPDLPVEYIRDGFRRLDSFDMVIGPSIDGGYYLIGASRMIPVFDNIQWGSNTVLDSTLKKANDHGISLSVLNEWYDIDRWEDLQKYLAAKAGNQKSCLDIKDVSD